MLSFVKFWDFVRDLEDTVEVGGGGAREPGGVGGAMLEGGESCSEGGLMYAPELPWEPLSDFLCGADGGGGEGDGVR